MVISFEISTKEEFDYEIDEQDAFDKLKKNNLLEEEDLEKDIEDIDFDYYKIELKDLFEKEAHEDYTYKKNPLKYHGMSKEDFI